MVEQLEQFKEKIDDKEDELQQVTAQLEISQREKLNIEMQMDSMVKQLEEEREQLQVSIMSIVTVVHQVNRHMLQLSLCLISIA